MVISYLRLEWWGWLESHSVASFSGGVEDSATRQRDWYLHPGDSLEFWLARPQDVFPEEYTAFGSLFGKCILDDLAVGWIRICQRQPSAQGRRRPQLHSALWETCQRRPTGC